MTAVFVVGLVAGALLTVGAQSLKRKIQRKIRKLLKPQVRGQIRNGRRVM
jgi:hypothetical protein